MISLPDSIANYKPSIGVTLFFVAVVLIGYMEYDWVRDELTAVRKDLLQEQLDHSETKEELQRFKELYYSQH